MNLEDQLTVAMRRVAETIDPPVEGMVDAGITCGRRRRLRRRVGAAAGVASAAVVVVTVAAIAFVPDQTPSRPPAVRLVNATEVLERAARSAQAQPGGTPRPHQWLYEKTIGFGIGTERGMRPVTTENWRRIDGSQEAGFHNGRLVVSNKSGASDYGSLASLPTDPRALRAAIYNKVDAHREGGLDRDGEAFLVITGLLWSHPVGIPPQTRSALYRAIATIPGVRIENGVKDGAGRPAIAVTRGYGEQFLLDPSTFQIVGQRTVSNGRNAPISKTRGVDPRFRVPVGTVTFSLTRLTAKVVDRPGQR